MNINYSDEPVIKGKKSIFLAGPTPRDKNIQSWRQEACRLLEAINYDGVVYIPEFSSFRPKESYIDQVEWEFDALNEATVVLFWIPRNINNMPGFTTNVEFGYWMRTDKVIYGRPDTAEKIKYLDCLYRKEYGKEPSRTLEETIISSVNYTNERWDDEYKKELKLS